MNKYIAAGIGCLFIAASLLAGCRNSGGWQHREDATYFLTASGEALSGWQEIEGHTYRFLDTGEMLTGWQEIEGETYYFAKDGAMASGWQEIGGRYFYFRESGTRVTGWLSLDGQRYYLTEEGAATGVCELEETLYLFDDTGLLTSGWAEAAGKRYYGNEFCHPVTGWQEIEGVRYFFGEDYAAHTGWLEDGAFTYYFTEDGSPARGKLTINGETHCFAFNGQKIILVNPWNSVPEDYTVELANIGNSHQLATYACADYKEMMTACRSAGLDPVVCSSYRTQEYQEYLYERRITRFEDQGYSETDAAAMAGTIVAYPGTSEHQLGLALDIIDNDNWNLDESQANMPTQKWLMEHSWEYGWILRYPNEKSEITGIIYEPWHYRYVGREVAADIYKSGLCLEEYLQSLTEE